SVAATQRVIIGVADFRRVLLVIKPVVMRDLRCEAFELGGGFFFGQFLNSERPAVAHTARPPAMRLAAAARASAVTVEPDSMRAISSCRVSGLSSSTRVTVLR